MATITEEVDSTKKPTALAAEEEEYPWLEPPQEENPWLENPSTNKALTTTINCHEDNGGCSHYCNDSKCECPPCWTLGHDSLKCQIDPAKIQVTCSDKGFTVEVDECLFIGDSEDVVTIGFMGDGGDMESCRTQQGRNGVHNVTPHPQKFT